MPLTHSFGELVRRHIAADSVFADALQREDPALARSFRALPDNVRDPHYVRRDTPDNQN